jgi:hypothetical protein
MLILILFTNVAVSDSLFIWLLNWGGDRDWERVLMFFFIENEGSHVFILVTSCLQTKDGIVIMMWKQLIYSFLLPLHEQDIAWRHSCLLLGYLGVYI